MEAWSEYRRTGYPKLMPAMHNLSDGVVDDAEGARRLSYPADEYRENGENLDAAVLALTKEQVIRRVIQWQPESGGIVSLLNNHSK